MKRGLIQLGMTAALLCLLPSARAANLAIGSTAPEIEGKDLENTPMKLSEFRGMVVVLDFWGHW